MTTSTFWLWVFLPNIFAWLGYVGGRLDERRLSARKDAPTVPTADGRLVGPYGKPPAIKGMSFCWGCHQMLPETFMMHLPELGSYQACQHCIDDRDYPDGYEDKAPPAQETK